jgi:hypothetical protein
VATEISRTNWLVQSRKEKGRTLKVRPLLFR